MTNVSRALARGTRKRARADAAPLVELGKMELGEVLARPSARNKSPYVADVRVGDAVAIAHAPNLDSGGKFRRGARVLCTRQPGVTATTMGAHGTPKCELVCRLLRCEERENAACEGGGVWVSAHPSLVERIALSLLENGALDDRLHASPTVKTDIKTQKMMKRQATESVSNTYRPDFAISHEDGTTTILEVKQVVDTDYSREFVQERARLQAPHPTYSPRSTPYVRAGIFPWGKRGQNGPDGEKVVSARAIEHLRELTELASDKKSGVHPAVLFICSRADVEGFRPNGAACPSFAAYLERAQRAGVRVLVQKVRWGEGEDLGKAFDAGALPLWPALKEGDEFVVKK